MATKEKTHNVEFAKGGKTKMFSEQAAEPQLEGTTRDRTADDNAPGAKFAAGGSKKMFAYAGSQPAQGGITSAR